MRRASHPAWSLEYIRGVPNAYSWLIDGTQKNSGPTIVDPPLVL
jgi:hypothetical protein